MAEKKENGRVLAVLMGFIFILAILWATNPPAKDALGAYLIFGGVTWFVYRFSSFKDKLIGIKTSNVGVSLGWALLFVGGFWILTKIFPGFSLGLPLTPQAIGDNLRFVIVIIFAGIIEELTFRGAILGYFRSLSIFKNKFYLANIFQALLFAVAHLTAYATNFYDYPSFTEGMTAFNANIASFGAAFIFGIGMGFLVSRPKISNMISAIVAHSLTNLIIYTGFSVIIGVVIPLIF